MSVYVNCVCVNICEREGCTHVGREGGRRERVRQREGGREGSRERGREGR